MALGKLLPRIIDHTGDAGKPKRGRHRNDWLYRVDVVDLLERCKIENVSQATAAEVNFSCPFSGHDSGDSTPSAYMNDGSKDRKKATAFKCHGCGRAGNAISFYAEHQGVSRQEARMLLREIYAPDYRLPKGGSISAELEERRCQRYEALHEQLYEAPVISWEAYYEKFGLEWPLGASADDFPGTPMAYMYRRGFTSATLNEWDIGYDEISDRLTIPVCNEHGDCIGVKGRTWHPKTKVRRKYMILGDKEGYRKRYGWPHYLKSEVLMGLHMAFGNTRVVLCEGELDVIACWQAGIPAVSTGSSSVSHTQEIIIRDNFDEVVVFFDSDSSGDKATYGFYNDSGEWKPGIVERLMPFMRVFVANPHVADPAKLVEDGDTDELLRLVSAAPSIMKLLRP